MGALNIVIGFDGPGTTAKPAPVYVGYSGTEAAKAMQDSSACRFELFRGVRGIRKHNARAAANAARDKAAGPVVDKAAGPVARPERPGTGRGARPR
jgi:hypothetical protein